MIGPAGAADAAGAERRAERHPGALAAVGGGVVAGDEDVGATRGNYRPGDDRLAAGVEREAGPARRGAGVADAAVVGAAGQLLPGAGGVAGDVNLELAAAVVGPGDVFGRGAGGDARLDRHAGAVADARAGRGAAQLGPAAAVIGAGRQRRGVLAGHLERAVGRHRVGEGGVRVGEAGAVAGQHVGGAAADEHVAAVVGEHGVGAAGAGVKHAQAVAAGNGVMAAAAPDAVVAGAAGAAGDRGEAAGGADDDIAAVAANDRAAGAAAADDDVLAGARFEVVGAGAALDVVAATAAHERAVAAAAVERGLAAEAAGVDHAVVGADGQERLVDTAERDRAGGGAREAGVRKGGVHEVPGHQPVQPAAAGDAGRAGPVGQVEDVVRRAAGQGGFADALEGKAAAVGAGEVPVAEGEVGVVAGDDALDAPPARERGHAGPAGYVDRVIGGTADEPDALDAV